MPLPRKTPGVVLPRLSYSCQQRSQRWLKRVVLDEETQEFFAPLECIATSPHGGQGGCIAVGFAFDDGRIDLLHAASGERIRTMRAPVPGGVSACSFSSNGAMIAAAGN